MAKTISSLPLDPQHLFQTLFDQSPISTQIFTPDGETILVNKAWEKLWHVQWKKLKQYNVLKDKQLVELDIMGYIERGFRGDTLHIPATKYEPPKTLDLKGIIPYRWVSAYIYPVKNKQGVIEYVVLQHRDVTDAIQKREALQESERLFKSIIDNSLNGFRLIDEKGNIRYASPSTHTLLGYSIEEFQKLNVLDLIHPEDKKAYREVLSYSIKHPREAVILEYRILHKNGQWRWMEGQGRNFLSDPDIKAIISTYQDITARKQFEESLWRTNQTLNAIIYASPLAVYVVDTKGRVTLWSKKAEEMFGWRAKEVIGRQLPIVQTQRIDEFTGLMQTLLAGKSFTTETIRQRKDGTLFDVSISASPILDEGGLVGSIVAITTDITERKAVERQKDDFMGIVSHELKTPVTSLKAYEQVLQNRFRKVGDSASADMLMKMDGQINKLTMLISDLLDVTKIEGGKLQFHEEPFVFDDLVEEVIEEVQRTADWHRIITDGATGANVVGDRERVGQVLTNLLTNAIKYSPSADVITVHLKITTRHIVCCVEDHGIGISADQMKLIFQRFYRVNEQLTNTIPGIGLGLYISKEIIIRQGGEIWVESKPKKGSLFCFRFPLRQKKS